MKNFSRTGSVLLAISLMSTSCFMGEPALHGTAREEYLRSIKSYMQYWEKPGASEDERLHEWRMCGGMQNGSYSSDVPSGSSIEVLLADSERKRLQLDQCMTEKGYQLIKGIR